MKTNVDMAGQDDLFHRGHRARLRQKFLDDKITNDELLELALSYVIPRRDVRPLAHKMMADFGDVFHILTAPLEKLQTYKGVGGNTAIFFKMIHRIMVNGYTACLKNQPIYRDANIIIEYFRSVLVGCSVEEFHVMYLDINMHLLADDVHSRGTVDWAAVYSREILKRALDLNASYVVLAHNHPLQDSKFSTDDVTMTDELNKILQSVGIKLYDHYLVTASGIVYSARNESLLRTVL